MNVRPLGSNLGSFSRKLSWLIAERRAPEQYFEVKGLICHNENRQFIAIRQIIALKDISI